MNLSDMRQRLMDELDWEIDSPDYIMYVDDCLNRAVRRVWDAANWTFARANAYVNVLPIVTGSAALGMTGSNMGRQITFGGSVPELELPWRQFDWQEQIFSDGQREYPVLFASSSSVLVLKVPYQIASGTTFATANWKLTQRFVNLPQDCERVVSVKQLDRPIAGIATSEVHQLTMLDINDPRFRSDQTADRPTFFARAPDLAVPAGQKQTISLTDSSYARAIPQGSYYKFAWCYGYAGKYGPVGSTGSLKQFTVGSQNFAESTLTFTDNLGRAISTPAGVDRSNTDSAFPVSNEGLFKFPLWDINTDRYSGQQNGNPCWVFVRNFHPSGSQLEHLPLSASWSDTSVDVKFLGQLDANFARHSPSSGQRIQLWPPVAAAHKEYQRVSIDSTHLAPTTHFRQMEVEYVKRPPALIYANDVPPMPERFHDIVCDAALKDLATRKNMTDRAAQYEANYQRGIKECKRFAVSTAKGQSRVSRDGSGFYGASVFNGGKVRITGEE